MSGFQGEQRDGDFRVVCDRSGFKCWASETVIEWNGLRVLRRFSEARHPQDFVRSVPDNPSVKNARPETTDVFTLATLQQESGLPIYTEASQPLEG